MLSNQIIFSFIVRIILGALVLFSFCAFARAAEKCFGQKVGTFLRLFTLTQFHFMFYASRPLPNTFAMSLGSASTLCNISFCLFSITCLSKMAWQGLPSCDCFRNSCNHYFPLWACASFWSFIPYYIYRWLAQHFSVQNNYCRGVHTHNFFRLFLKRFI